MKKLNDIVIYDDTHYFSAFPSIVALDNDELLVTFRRAPDRRIYGGKCTHADPNANLVSVRSNDGGKAWSKKPSPVFSHPMGGSQDPCMTRLRDGTILCTSYLFLLQQPQCPAGGTYDNTGIKMTFAGGYFLRSRDGGRHWQGPIIPPSLPNEKATDAFHKPLPTYNRGNILEGSDGLLYWAVVRADKAQDPGTGGSITSVHLIVSADKGDTWQYRCPIAVDAKIGFNETYLYETARGELVAFLRTADELQTVKCAIARSRNRGMSFETWENMGFEGHPFSTARLPDGRVLLTYGYRIEPFGIRARILNDDCTDVTTANEIVIRDDGGYIDRSRKHEGMWWDDHLGRPDDLGYPWPLVFPDGRVLVVYYFNKLGGSRHIAGTWLQV